MIVSAGGLKLRVDRRGEGAPLLLITGIGAHLDMWRPFQAVAGERELISFDAPGVGRSQRPGRPMRMRALARLVAELLDALALERADVLGYSWGGGLAQELAHRYPDRVRRLVLCATAPGLGGVPPRPLAALMLATPARYYHPKLAEWSLPLIAGGSVAPGHVRDRLAAPPSVLGYGFQLYATAGWSSLPWLHTLPHETLVVAGDDDPAVPFTNARILAARIPHARLERVRGGGHLFLLDDPERAAAPIRAFLDM
ncbi:alpha/beta fold hydrolase [Solirubrobacter ginsenosidimutans]|uniref:Alpha/beta fold hydrolase n=1 Tax=Solirubrobacter ginsenosidimutans TaxID=490573 RepID=A0A9X3S061_9ACTN|nr:alpha/beta fold hydrolase [Solirubrobacter ginsenosidimutans]MDA0161700.1 alpha/beta fold hydrolase [Solirubrobacter ginsenosidimutans]